jgi:hypothetical protein
MKKVIRFMEWDLKNAQSANISSGVYLFHVQANDIGERILKWFVLSRKDGGISTSNSTAREYACYAAHLPGCIPNLFSISHSQPQYAPAMAIVA